MQDHFHRRIAAVGNPPRRDSVCRRPLRFERLEPRAMLSAGGDFNGDGFDDLAVGAPDEEVTVGTVNTGAVNIIYGGRKGLTTVGNQFWHLDVSGVNGVAGDNDRFGSALAVGDFNGDGFGDLAVGIPGRTVGGFADAGAVSVLYGSKNGLRAGAVDQLWTQDSPGVNDHAELFDRFGAALAAGDFDGDGRDDLAIGAPSENVGGIAAAGMVNVLYGSSKGLTAKNDQHWHQNSPGINDAVENNNEGFGFALAAGDFDGDGRDDLAIDVWNESVGGFPGAGMVHVLYGSPSGLTGVGDQHWHHDSPDVAGDPAQNDHFGAALAAGDFNRDGRDDLAVGVPSKNIGILGDVGQVNLLYGSSTGLRSTGGTKLLTAGSLGFASIANAQFGFALAVGDFDDDGRVDLAIGAPTETVSGFTNAGAVYVAFGSSNVGLKVAGAERWTQEDFGVASQQGDDFGYALATGDYNGDGFIDLAIGAPFRGFQNEGAVHLVYGFRLIDPKRPFWSQDQLDASDNDNLDWFGFALG